MDYLVLLQKHQPLQYLHRIVPNLVGREADEARGFEMLKEVGMQQLKHKAVVLSKVGLIDHSHDIVLIVRVFLHDVF